MGPGCGSAGRLVDDQSDGLWFDPRPPQSACRSVLWQDTETQIAPTGSSIDVWVYVWMVIAPDEQVAPRMVASATSVWMCVWMDECGLVLQSASSGRLDQKSGV